MTQLALLAELPPRTETPWPTIRAYLKAKQIRYYLDRTKDGQWYSIKPRWEATPKALGEEVTTWLRLHAKGRQMAHDHRVWRFWVRR